MSQLGNTILHYITQDEVLLTARHVQVAGLLVQGEEGEVHGACARDGDPAT